jgi:hypothetical protein
MIEKNKWTKEDMKKIQYYTSGEIKLLKENSNGGSNIEGGVIKQETNKIIDEVTIASNTKGVAVNFPNDNIGISFEKDDNHFLTFGVNPDRNGYFVLLGSEWRDGIAKVTYNGEKYTTSPDSKKVVLLVDMRRVKKLKLNQRNAPGRTIK